MTIKLSNSNSHLSPAAQVNEIYLDDPQVRGFTALKPGDALRCMQGLLWVTQEGDREDYILRQGEQLVISRRGLVVVEGMQNAALRLESQAHKN